MTYESPFREYPRRNRHFSSFPVLESAGAGLLLKGLHSADSTQTYGVDWAAQSHT